MIAWVMGIDGIFVLFWFMVTVIAVLMVWHVYDAVRYAHKLRETQRELAGSIARHRATLDAQDEEKVSGDQRWQSARRC